MRDIVLLDREEKASDNASPQRAISMGLGPRKSNPSVLERRELIVQVALHVLWCVHRREILNSGERRLVESRLPGALKLSLQCFTNETVFLL